MPLVRASIRLTRSAALAATGLAALLGGSLGVWVAYEPEVERFERPSVARTTGPVAPRAGPAAPAVARPDVQGPPVALPADLALLQAGRLSGAEAVAAVASTSCSAGERLLALRTLAREDPRAAVAGAEALVLEAGDSREERALAGSALGVLARTEGGRAALERCARDARGDDLRAAARLLLARR